MDIGFVVDVDGKTYGPFLENQKKKFSHLQNKRGVVFRQVFLADEQSSQGKARQGKARQGKARTPLSPCSTD